MRDIRALLLSPLLFFSISLAQVPLNDLIRHAEIEQVKISPSGTHLAIRKLHEGERIIVFMSLQPLNFSGVLRFRGKEEVGEFYWANDERLIAAIISRRAALERPVNYGSLFAIDYDGTRGRNIFGWAATERRQASRVSRADATYAHGTLVDTLEDDKDEVLISTYPWARDWETHGEVYRLNIYTGVKKKVARLPQVDGRAYTDGQGNLLFANGTDRNNDNQLYTRDRAGWKRVGNPVLDDAIPVGFDPKTGKAYLVLEQDQKIARLVEWQPPTGEISDLYQHEFADITGIIYQPVTDKPIGVYVDPGYPEEHFFDDGDGFQAMFRGLKKAFDGHRIAFTSFAKDGSKGILEVSGDRLPGDYYLVDMHTRKAEFLLSSAEWLDPNELNPMHADSFLTEDGYRIGVYLTFPEKQTNKLPMVVVPHGGPHQRNYWGYDRNAQILSQNGYLVLQVNFRGSTGYGDAFFEAGKLQWGGKIQQDIADAVNWTVEKGYADRERICIYGASFGGYSALMNPIRYPDLYQCAVGYVGVYDLELLYQEGDIQRRERGIAYLEGTVGSDSQHMAENSPLNNLGKLNLPLFIVHGKRDERAPPAHAEALLERLESMDKDVQSLIVPTEGHGFYSEDNNRKFYTQLLAFLDQHIGAGSVAKN